MLTSWRPEGDGVLFRQLECFLAVARLGNLSRAAEEMYLTQPTLTARIKALEEELGDPLFVRTSRGCGSRRLAGSFSFMRRGSWGGSRKESGGGRSSGGHGGGGSGSGLLP